MKDLFKIKVATHVCRVTPLGLAPLAPGTAGSVFGVLLAVVAWQGGFFSYLMVTTLVVFLGTWAADLYEKNSREHDDRRIVVDEVAGMMLALAGWERASITVIILAFISFRVLDILKPWPISWIDKRLGGGIGVMADDIAAGILCIILLEILRPFI